MGGDRIIGGHSLLGGISYDDLEELDIHLGSGDDFVTIASTHTGLTTLDTGPGRDTVDVRTISGHTQISTGPERDVVNVGSGVATVPGTSGGTHLVNEIGALLVIDGGANEITGEATGSTATTLTDTNAHFASALPAGAVVDTGRTAVRILTPATIGTLSFDRTTQTATFTPSARFDDFDVFAFEYDLYDSHGNKAAVSLPGGAGPYQRDKGSRSSTMTWTASQCASPKSNGPAARAWPVES